MLPCLDKLRGTGKGTLLTQSLRWPYMCSGVRVAVAGKPATVTPISFATRKFSAAAESPAALAAAAEAGDSLSDRLDEAK